MSERQNLTARRTRWARLKRLWFAVPLCLGTSFCAPLYAASQTSPISEVWIVPLSHTDFGYTDQPAVTRDLHRRYVDIALDAALRTRHLPAGDRFCWTIETQYTFLDWWTAATPQRRIQFVEMVQSGQMDVSALAIDNTPYMTAEEWAQMTQWAPADVLKHVRPQTGVQDDVNGFPRSGAMALLDHGVTKLWTGINNDFGGAPLNRPSSFWWKMPDGRRMFVWLGIPYSEGYNYFHPNGWRRGPLPKAGDALYRPPGVGELLPTDPASLREQHDYLVHKLQEQVAKGYRQSVFILPFTNQWRLDNDPPYPALTDFVQHWNSAGLMPRLRLATATASVEEMQKLGGIDTPEYSGEFPDWWANGTVSDPRSLSASRFAKRYLQESMSSVFGPVRGDVAMKRADINRDLVVFDEHSWGAGHSIAEPYSLDSEGEFAEKSLHAYRSMAQAQWLLSQRARTGMAAQGEGLFVANATHEPWTGWVRFPSSALRGEYLSVRDSGTGACEPIDFERGMKPFTAPAGPQDITPQNRSLVFADNVPHQVARVWIGKLQGDAFARFQLSTAACPAQSPSPAAAGPAIGLDARGWPSSIKWPGMADPLISGEFGDFSSVKVNGFAPRDVAHKIWDLEDPARRVTELRKSLETEVAREAGQAEQQDTGKTIIFTQPLLHTRLGWAVRRIEIWKSEPRVRFDLKLYRLSSELPEAYFVSFSLPTQGTHPEVSNGGVPFTPYSDQIPGSCKDYFATDGWVRYATPHGEWLLVSRDAPLLTFGEPNLLAKRVDAPANTNRVLAMVYNNLWHTNFVANAAGEMDFRFDLAWRDHITSSSAAARIADSLTSDPVLVINPSWPIDPLYQKYLFTP